FRTIYFLSHVCDDLFNSLNRPLRRATMFNKKLILSFILFLPVFILISCSPSYDLATEGPIVMISTSPAGPDDYRHLISEYITVYADGTVVLSHEENPEKDAPTFQTKINKDDTRQIEDLIRDEKFQ